MSISPVVMCTYVNTKSVRAVVGVCEVLPAESADYDYQVYTWFTPALYLMPLVPIHLIFS